MPLHDSLGSSDAVKLPKMNSMPTTEDLKFALMQVTKKNGAKFCELPFEHPTNHQTFVVKVTCRPGTKEPTWTLIRGDGAGAKAMWSRSADVMIIQNKIKIDSQYVDGNTGSAAQDVDIPSHEWDGAPKRKSAIKIAAAPSFSKNESERGSQPIILGGPTGGDPAPANVADAVGGTFGSPAPPTLDAFFGRDYPPQLNAFIAQPAPEAPPARTITQEPATFIPNAAPVQDYKPIERKSPRTVEQPAAATAVEAPPSHAVTQPVEPSPLRRSVTAPFQASSSSETASSMQSNAPSATAPRVEPELPVTQENAVAIAPAPAIELPPEPPPKPKPPSVPLPPPIKFDKKVVNEVHRQLANEETGLMSYPAFVFFLFRDYVLFQKSKVPFSIVIFEVAIRGGSGVLPLPPSAVTTIADLIRRVAGPLDILTHLHAGEFGALVASANGDAAIEFAAALNDALTENPVSLGGQEFTLIVAAGAASIPETCSHPEVLVAAARQAKEMAKMANTSYMLFPA